MTIIAWDGLTVAADSMTTDKRNGQCYQSLKIQRLIQPLTVSTKCPAVITAVAAAGNRSITSTLVKAIIGFKTGTLSEYLRKREELGAYWPEWDSCQIAVIGLLKDKPFFAIIRQGQVREALKPVTLGVSYTPIDTFVSAVTPAEYVFTMSHLYPDSCGGEITSYDPATDALSFVDTSGFNPEEIKAKLTTAFINYLSKVDDPSNLRYSAPTIDESTNEASNDE